MKIPVEVRDITQKLLKNIVRSNSAIGIYKNNKDLHFVTVFLDSLMALFMFSFIVLIT